MISVTYSNFQLHYVVFVNCFSFCRYYQSFLMSDHHCQHQVNLLTQTKVRLSDILYNEASMFYFMEVSNKEPMIYRHPSGQMAQLLCCETGCLELLYNVVPWYSTVYCILHLFWSVFQFMELEGLTSLLQCLLAMDNFQQHLSDQQQHRKQLSELSQNDAVIIYDK